jgi:hypothetical protein
MASFKSNPVFSSLILLCGLAAAAEIYLILPFKLPGSLYEQSRKSLARLVQLKQDSEKYLTTDPTPNEENQKLIAGDVDAALKNLSELRDALTGKGGLAGALRAVPAPTDPQDAYFKIVTSREAWVEKFEKAEYPVPGRPDLPTRKIDLLGGPTQWFGFASHKQSGPVGAEQIAKVFRQMQVADYLLNSLVAAEPFQFVSLQREAPISKAEMAERDKLLKEAKERNQAAPIFSTNVTGVGVDMSDFFDIDPLLTARVPGRVETMPFRLTFVARSEALRTLLNKLAAFELPLVVRRVDVEVAEMEAPLPPAPDPEFDDDGNPIEIEPLDMRVKQLLSKFTVTIEYIDLVAPEAAASQAETKSAP